MIKTKNGKTVIKGDILEDVSDLCCILNSLEGKYNINFVEATTKTIITQIHNKNKKLKLEKLLNSL